MTNWKKAQEKSYKTMKNAKLFTKYALQKRKYLCLHLDAKSGYEWKGIVDMIAVKKDTKRPDRLKIILVQIKGGGARITDKEKRRLINATKKFKIDWVVASKPHKKVIFLNEKAL